MKPPRELNTERLPQLFDRGLGSEPAIARDRLEGGQDVTERERMALGGERAEPHRGQLLHDS